MPRLKSKITPTLIEGEAIVDVVFRASRYRHLFTLHSRLTYQTFCESIKNGFGCPEEPSYVLRFNTTIGILVPLPAEKWKELLSELGPVRQRMMVVFLDGKPQSNHELLEIEPAEMSPCGSVSKPTIV